MMEKIDRPRNVTTEAIVQSFTDIKPVFDGLLTEVRELSKKKPEAIMSSGKVKIINRVLADLLTFLSHQPEGKYLEELDNETLPQISDALMVMVQFETALTSFSKRYRAKDEFNLFETHWITEEYLADRG